MRCQYGQRILTCATTLCSASCRQEHKTSDGHRLLCAPEAQGSPPESLRTELIIVNHIEHLTGPITSKTGTRQRVRYHPLSPFPEGKTFCCIAEDRSETEGCLHSHYRPRTY